MDCATFSGGEATKVSVTANKTVIEQSKGIGLFVFHGIPYPPITTDNIDRLDTINASGVYPEFDSAFQTEFVAKLPFSMKLLNGGNEDVAKKERPDPVASAKAQGYDVVFDAVIVPDLGGFMDVNHQPVDMVSAELYIQARQTSDGKVLWKAWFCTPTVGVSRFQDKSEAFRNAARQAAKGAFNIYTTKRCQSRLL